MIGYLVILAIKLALDKYSASTSAVIGPAFLDEELCEFANQAMLETISTKFTGHNQLQLGFEQSAKRVADLEKLIVTKVTELKNITGTNRWTTGNLGDFEDCMFLVSAKIRLVKNDTPAYVPAELINRTTATKFEQTPTNYPYIPTPKIITTADTSQKGLPVKGATVYLDPTWTNKYEKIELITEHVAQPLDLCDCNLSQIAFGGMFSDAVLYEIINRAALLALDNIESQRTEVKASLNNTQE